MGTRILQVDYEVFVDLFKSGRRCFDVTKNPLPEDAYLVSVRHNPTASSNGLLELIIRSSEWLGEEELHMAPEMTRYDCEHVHEA